MVAASFAKRMEGNVFKVRIVFKESGFSLRQFNAPVMAMNITGEAYMQF